MKDTFKKIQLKVSTLLVHHQTFVVVALLLALTTGVVFRLTNLSNMEPSQEVIDDQVRSVKSVIFNEDAVEKIEALRDSNVKKPGTQVQQNRDNPFRE